MSGAAAPRGRKKLKVVTKPGPAPAAGPPVVSGPTVPGPVVPGPVVPGPVGLGCLGVRYSGLRAGEGASEGGGG